ncbi:hypothetical protein ACSSVY_004147 [Roseovarius sp. MBR-51]|jgi:hypothetical protein
MSLPGHVSVAGASGVIGRNAVVSAAPIPFCRFEAICGSSSVELSDLSLGGSSFITRVCGFDFDITGFGLGKRVGRGAFKLLKRLARL